MNLSVTIPKNWQKDSFEVWFWKLQQKLKHEKTVYICQN